MAEAQAPTAIRTSPTFNNLLSNCEYISLRPFGRHGNLVVYNVFEGNPKSRTVARRIICVIEVDESTQDIQVKLNYNGPILITAKYGMAAHQSKMYIFYPESSVQLAELTYDWAVASGDPGSRLDFQNSVTFPNTKCIVRSASNRVVGTLYSRMQTTCAWFMGVQSSDIQKVLMLMNMLKLYYCTYQFHLTPKPANILSRMPPIPLVAPTIQYLRPMSNTLMRSACWTSESSYIEVLDAATHQIILIIECKLDDPNSKKIFRDHHGTAHFECENEGNTCSVHTVTGKLIGSYANPDPQTAVFFDTYGGAPILTENRKAAPAGGKHWQVTSTSDNQLIVAEYYTLSSASSVQSILMPQTILDEWKALILARASYKAIVRAGIFEAPAPDMDTYPFRPIS